MCLNILAFTMSGFDHESDAFWVRGFAILLYIIAYIDLYVYRDIIAYIDIYIKQEHWTYFIRYNIP